MHRSQKRIKFHTLLFVSLLLIALTGFTVSALAQVPRVPPQEPGPDGGLVHVVQYGNTLEGIMAAYASYGITMEQLRQLNGWRYPPQFIFVDEQIIILPPGSVAPGGGVAAPAAISTGSENLTSGTESQQPQTGDIAPPPTASLTTRTADEISAIPPVEVIAPFLP